jgi:hypothetical protein
MVPRHAGFGGGCSRLADFLQLIASRLEASEPVACERHRKFHELFI